MRLIDADKIRYAKDWVVTDRISKVGGYNAKAIYRVTKEEIDAMPTVDTVPVVRCAVAQYEKALMEERDEQTRIKKYRFRDGSVLKVTYKLEKKDAR